MGFLTIDESKCKKDSICAGDCPAMIIQLKDGGYPEMVPGGETMCTLCGHCVAVCPHSALSHAKVPIEDSPSIKKELKINDAQAEQFLRSRRSIRRFKDQSVEKEKIQRLIEIARYAPTGSNSQLVEWHVVTDKAEIKKLAGHTVDFMRDMVKKAPDHPYAVIANLLSGAWDMGFDGIFWDAPVVIVASAPKSAMSGSIDIIIAMTYLELAAQTLGLGTCWAGLAENALKSWQPLKDAVGLPEKNIYHQPMMLGYSKSRYQRLPERKTPKITWR